ncbi:MAG: lysylphosphatidylglycerol synthase transmembrane domain-containing protein [Candidatus Alcyoniella australis]|nr:lysylphosphatidylglycerol synthase transmembrane domain-containing protein [Candidatus Alcyoniella australis]
MRFLKSWKFWLSISVSALFIYLFLRSTDLSEIGHEMAQADWLLVAMNIALLFPLLYLRGYRWKLLVKPIKDVRAWILFESTCIGFATNNILPARMGELAKAYYLGKRGGLPVTKSFSSVVTERLYDTFTLFGMVIVLLFFYEFPWFDQVFTKPILAGTRFEFTPTQESLKLIMAVGYVAGLAFTIGVLWGLKRRTEQTIRVLLWPLKPFSQRLRDKLAELLRHFIGGFVHPTKPLEVFLLLLTSVLLWVFSVFVVHASVAAFDVLLDFRQASFVLVAVIFAIMIPASPGYVGTYHYAVGISLVAVTAMTAVPVTPEKAAGIAVVVHAVNYLPQTLSGLFFMAKAGIGISDISHAPEETESE